MEELTNMPVQTEEEDYAKHHRVGMDMIVKDGIASLKGETVVDFTPYKPKIVEQMKLNGVEL